jgi:hypothetical protein
MNLPDNYQPRIGDSISQNGITLTVEDIYGGQVRISFSKGQEPYSLTMEDFLRKAHFTIGKGATLTLANPQPLPTPQPIPTMTTDTPGLTGSSNTHARLSPSDSKRWSNCTASIAFQEANAHRVKKDDSSSYADEGTEAHEWAAKALLGKITIDAIPQPFTEPVGNYVRRCQSLIPDAVLTHLDSCIEKSELGFDPPEEAFFVEEEIPLFYQSEQKGTSDFIAIRAQGQVVTHLYGRDYKHGAGVLVNTNENSQLAIYIYSAIKRLQGAYIFPDDLEINMSVDQPRHREAESQTPWVIRLADLHTFCEDIAEQAEAARNAAEMVREKIGAPGKDVSNDAILEAAPHARFAPSEGDSGACRWCKCKAFCVTHNEVGTEGLELSHMTAAEMLATMPQLDKEESKLPVEERLARVSEIFGDGRIITDQYLVSLVARKKYITALLSDAEEYLEGRLLDGEEIEGVKLVDGREGNREWANEEAADTFLKGQGMKQEERYDYKLKSPAKVEALLKSKLKASTRTKNRFEELITRPAGKKKLAISDDVRQAVPAALASMPNMEVEEFEV